jgi:hypothetical protein
VHLRQFHFDSAKLSLFLKP